MRLKLTLLLFFLNLVVFGLILVFEERGRDSGEGSRQNGLLGSVVLQAERLIISGPEMEPRILEKSEDGRSWTLLNPSPWPANLFAVSRIFNQLQFLEEEVSFTIEEMTRSGQTLADYGLENPDLTLTLEIPDGETSLKIGSVTEMGNRLYLLGPREERIYVVDRRVLESVLVGLGELRNSRIFEIPVFEVRSLNMRITVPGDVTIRLVRVGENWAFEAPLAAPADPALVNTTIKELTGIEASRVFEPGEVDPALSGLGAPTRRVTLEGNGRRQTLLLGNEVTDGTSGEKRVFARLEDNPTIVTVPAGPFDDLFEAQQKLRDPTVFRIEPDQLNTIEVGHAGRQITLQRLESGGGQVLEIGPGGLVSTQPADPDIMHNLINGLERLEAREFVSDAPSASALSETFGLTDPQWTLNLTAAGTTYRLRIGNLYRREDQQLLLYAKRESSSSVYGLSQEILALLRIDPLHYRDRRLRVLPSGTRITGLKLTDLRENAVLLDLEIDPRTESWASKLETQDLEPRRREALLDLQQSLRNVRVAGYLRDEYTDQYLNEAERQVPWAFRLEVTLLLTGSESNQTTVEHYDLTERLSGNFIAAGSPEFDLLFQLNREMIQALEPFIFTGPLPGDYERPEPVPLEELDPALPPADLPGTPEETPVD